MRQLYLTKKDVPQEDEIFGAEAARKLIQEILDEYGLSSVKIKPSSYGKRAGEHNWEGGNAQIRLYSKQFPIQIQIPDGEMHNLEKSLISDIIKQTGLTDILEPSVSGTYTTIDDLK